MSPVESNFFTLALIAYVLSLAAFFSFLWTRSERTGKIGFALLAAGALCHLVSLTARSIAAGRWPFANLYECLSLTVLALAIATFAGGTLYRLPALGIFATPVIVGLTGYAFSIRKAAEALVPALQSYWLQFHVATAIFAYGAFGLAFAMAIMYLVKERVGGAQTWLGTLIPETGKLDRLIYGTIAFGFAFQTLVIITGAVWAEQAWGAWWSWDPKETWALITWIVYAFYLHGWTRGSWRGRRGAWLSILGFIVVLFTWFGVSYLMEGLHSY